VDAALSQVDFALKRAPDDPYVLLEHARCSLDVLSFASARKSIDKALALAQSALHESDAWHLDVEFYQRLGSFCIDTKEYSRAMDAMTAVRQSFDSIPPTIRDQLVRQLSACYGTLWCVINDAGDDALSVRAKDLLSWLDSVPGQRRPPVISLSSERMLGVVRYRHPAKPFAFLTAEGSLDVFLGRNNMRFAADFDLLRPGVRVSFIMAIGENGRKALDTTID
jgi:cold shock CspA family protein